MKFVKQTKIVQVQAHDNYNLDVKIDYPANSESVIIFCHGSGANTYDNHREIAGKEFNYFDLFVDEFCKRNIALEYKRVQNIRYSPRFCIYQP